MIGKDEVRGTWFVQIKIKDPVTGKATWKKKRGFATKREAKLFEAKMMEDKNLPTHKATFREVSEQYFISKECSPDTIQKHRSRYSSAFSDYYDMPIEEITRPMLEKWRNRIAQSDYAYLTKNDTLQYVRSVFHYAADIYGISDPSVVLKSFKKPISATSETMHVWTVAQFDQFLCAVENPLYALFFETLFWTGMRRGEAIALQKTDLTGNELYIHGSMKHYKNGINPPKNSSSIRTITLDDQLVRDLQPLMAIDGPFLFGGETSLSISEIQRQFTKAISRSGVPHIRIHDLRHSHATILINAGVNIVAVSKRLGHASIEQTLKTYTHLLQSTDQQMMEEIKKLRKSEKVCQK